MQQKRDYKGRRDYTVDDISWVMQYDATLVYWILNIMAQEDDQGDDMKYFMHLMQIGRRYEWEELKRNDPIQQGFNRPHY